MLSPSEKAYYAALEALRRKEYRMAMESFDAAAAEFGNNREFVLLAESTRLLLAVKQELHGTGPGFEVKNEESFIEEVFSDGQKTDIPG